MARRLGLTPHVGLPVTVGLERDVEEIARVAKTASVLVVDSIQTIRVDPRRSLGSPTEMRAAVQRFMNFAREEEKIVILLSHVLKDGDARLPAASQYAVDAILYLLFYAVWDDFGENKTPNLREIRDEGKNRFAASGSALLEMTERGFEEPSLATRRVLSKNNA